MTNTCKQATVLSVKDFVVEHHNLKSFNLNQLDDAVGEQGANEWTIEHAEKQYNVKSAGKPIYPLAVFTHDGADHLVSLNCNEVHPNLSVLKLGDENAQPYSNNEKMLALHFKNPELMQLLRFLSYDLFHLNFTNRGVKVDAKTYEVETLLCSVKFQGELISSTDSVDSYEIIFEDSRMTFNHDKVNDCYNFSKAQAVKAVA